MVIAPSGPMLLYRKSSNDKFAVKATLGYVKGVAIHKIKKLSCCHRIYKSHRFLCVLYHFNLIFAAIWDMICWASLGFSLFFLLETKYCNDLIGSACWFLFHCSIFLASTRKLSLVYPICKSSLAIAICLRSYCQSDPHNS